jgi:hypothetical protein
MLLLADHVATIGDRDYEFVMLAMNLFQLPGMTVRDAVVLIARQGTSERRRAFARRFLFRWMVSL